MSFKNLRKEQNTEKRYKSVFLALYVIIIFLCIMACAFLPKALSAYQSRYFVPVYAYFKVFGLPVLYFAIGFCMRGLFSLLHARYLIRVLVAAVLVGLYVVAVSGYFLNHAALYSSLAAIDFTGVFLIAGALIYPSN